MKNGAAVTLVPPRHFTSPDRRRVHQAATRPKIIQATRQIDGGILANNPSLCAIAEIAQDTSLDNIRVVSFGTGQPKGRITPRQATSWGAFDWADILKGIPLYQVCSDGSADVIDFIAQSLLKDNYIRYQPVIDPKISTFQADEKNLNLLRKAANNYLENGGSNGLKELAYKLINS